MSAQPIRQVKPYPMAELAGALEAVILEIVREELAIRERTESKLFRWITAKEAGELLGIKTDSVSARVRQGKLPGRLYAGRVYVDRAALEAEIDSATLPSA
jgi:hypothetical protein